MEISVCVQEPCGYLLLHILSDFFINSYDTSLIYKRYKRSHSNPDQTIELLCQNGNMLRQISH